MVVLHCMTWTATITSQRQITIPAELFHKKVFSPGEKVVVETTNNGISITSSLKLVEELAGSIPIPKRFKGLTADQIIEKAKDEYFERKFSKKI